MTEENNEGSVEKKTKRSTHRSSTSKKTTTGKDSSNTKATTEGIAEPVASSSNTQPKAKTKKPSTAVKRGKKGTSQPVEKTIEPSSQMTSIKDTIETVDPSSDPRPNEFNNVPKSSSEHSTDSSGKSDLADFVRSDDVSSAEIEQNIQAHDAFLAQEQGLERSEENYLQTPSETHHPDHSSLKRFHVKSKNSLERLLNIIIRPFAPPIPIKKLLLSNEIVVDNVLLVYFTEGQLILGVLLAIIGVYIVGLLPFKLLGGVIILIGILFFFTASGSEEIYITSSRLLIRRLNLADRLFHIPRDEQYLIKQAVSFQIGRAPVNRILILIDVFLVFWNIYLPPTVILALLIWITIVFSFYYSLRIRKRAISFQMSGGGNVAIGINKGIPMRFVQNFTETLLSRTLELY